MKEVIEKVLEAGKSTEEQYKLLYVKLGCQRFESERGDEVFWGIPLDESHFIFANNILSFFGHHIVGRVGIHRKNKMLHKKTVDYFVEIDKKG